MQERYKVSAAERRLAKGAKRDAYEKKRQERKQRKEAAAKRRKTLSKAREMRRQEEMDASSAESVVQAQKMTPYERAQFKNIYNNKKKMVSLGLLTEVPQHDVGLFKSIVALESQSQALAEGKLLFKQQQQPDKNYKQGKTDAAIEGEKAKEKGKGTGKIGAHSFRKECYSRSNRGTLETRNIERR